ncbi:uncharacterized protein METZ01_LOCUS451056, partial [marine metagenome]
MPAVICGAMQVAIWRDLFSCRSDDCIHFREIFTESFSEFQPNGSFV